MGPGSSGKGRRRRRDEEGEGRVGKTGWWRELVPKSKSPKISKWTTATTMTTTTLQSFSGDVARDDYAAATSSGDVDPSVQATAVSATEANGRAASDAAVGHQSGGSEDGVGAKALGAKALGGKDAKQSQLYGGFSFGFGD